MFMLKFIILSKKNRCVLQKNKFPHGKCSAMCQDGIQKIDWQYWFPWIKFNCNKVNARFICTKLSVYTRRAFCIQFIYVVCDWAHGVIAIKHAHNVAVIGGGGGSGAFASRTKKKLFTISYQTACFQLTNVDNLLLILLAGLIIEINIFQCIIALDATDCSGSIICLDEMNETTSDFGEW